MSYADTFWHLQVTNNIKSRAVDTKSTQYYCKHGVGHSCFSSRPY